MLSPKLPFGLTSGKQSPSHALGFAKNQSQVMTNAGTSHRNSNEGVIGGGSITARPSQFHMPTVKGSQTRNFMPGALTLDTDSELDVSKI